MFYVFRRYKVHTTKFPFHVFDRSEIHIQAFGDICMEHYHFRSSSPQNYILKYVLKRSHKTEEKQHGT